MDVELCGIRYIICVFFVDLKVCHEDALCLIREIAHKFALFSSYVCHYQMVSDDTLHESVLPADHGLSRQWCPFQASPHQLVSRVMDSPPGRHRDGAGRRMKGHHLPIGLDGNCHGGCVGDRFEGWPRTPKASGQGG